MKIILGISLILLIFAVLAAAACWLLKQPFVVPVRSESPPVEVSRLETHVRTLAQNFYPRSFDRPENLEHAASYIRAELAGSGGKVAEQVFPVEGRRYRNIVAHYGPEQGPVLVIGAHYDSFADTPGADDNASGVAGLLELGRLLSKTPPAVRVELVAYCLEEPPHFRTSAMGSSWHARELRKSGREVRLMLSLEMIGYFRDAPGSQGYPFPFLNWMYPDRADFIAVVGRIQDWSATRRVKALMQGAGDLPVHSINAPTLVPGIDFSDHSNYWNEGFSALMITDTAFYRNPYYHGLDDTPDKLDYARMAKVVQGVYAVVQSKK